MGRWIHSGPIASWRYQASWPGLLPLCHLSSATFRVVTAATRPPAPPGPLGGRGDPVGALASWPAAGSDSPSGRQPGRLCADGVRTLRVAVTPELAGIVTTVAASVDDQLGWCLHADGRHRPASSSAVATSLAYDRSRPLAAPDVWIPDSSAWLRRSAVGPLRLPDRQPVRCAQPDRGRGDPHDRGASRLEQPDGGPQPVAGTGIAAGRPADIYLPDPQGSAAAAGALLSLQATAAQQPDGPAALTAALLGHVGSAVGDGAAPDRSRAAGCRRARGRRPRASSRCGRTTGPRRRRKPVVAAYPSLRASSLDYPWVVAGPGAASTGGRRPPAGGA